MLNPDIDIHIFHILSITSKRAFLRTNKALNQLSIHMPKIETDFQAMLNDIAFFGNYYTSLYYPLHKYTAELLYDGRNIPNRYITIENNVLHVHHKVYRRLTKNGDNRVVKKLLRLGPCCVNPVFVMYAAAKVGNIKMLKWMLSDGYQTKGKIKNIKMMEWMNPGEQGHQTKERIIAYAAKGNQLETLKWLINRGFPISSWTVNIAGGKGHMDILRFLIEKGCAIDGHLAARNGQFEVVKYFYSVDPSSSHWISNAAFASGHLEMSKYICQKGSYINKQNIMCDNVHILSWLIDNQHIIPSKSTSENIAGTGNLECMQLLHHHNYPILTENVFARAVSSRSVELIIWLHDLNCPFDNEATINAVTYVSKRPSLIILKMLVEWGCPLHPKICAHVARNGDLDMLKYLVSRGCSMDESVIRIAASGGHLHIIIWAREMGCPWDAGACTSTVTGNHLYILKWLRGIDRDKCGLKSNETKICLWDDTFEAAIVHHDDRFHMLEFAKANGYGMSYEEMLRSKTVRNNPMLSKMLC